MPVLSDYEATVSGTEMESVFSPRQRFQEAYGLGTGDDGDDGTPTSSRPT